MPFKMKISAVQGEQQHAVIISLTKLSSINMKSHRNILNDFPQALLSVNVSSE